MTTPLWRIAVEAPAYSANDLTGAGAKISGGRWNSIGTPLIYSAANIALATIETVLHVRSGGLPFNHFLVRIDVPDTVWASRLVLDPLPGGWDAVPSGMTSRATGDAWAASGSSALLLVPSVCVPDEYNVLINPRHPDVASITATTIRRWIYDPRFFA
ncbi:RES domain-containing protein [Duganella sp. BJB488]|uniref:RES family NAD+ phosphorylase n=1 Tax=unclassified Duganella TaxID=2636909 RepID=UPI000E34EDFD|nr:MULTISPECIES: RES family NAD+ phosphorylase [unclassified Duganella]RFP10349.1 RES domain-containing protein [Duganella sp. BJB489]RFP18059.1 RES domain-containing protein [Duganella sp. BJB488]RFP37814.1 RES domain-containing protein [Duganella sp. BJB480]